MPYTNFPERKTLAASPGAPDPRPQYDPRQGTTASELEGLGQGTPQFPSHSRAQEDDIDRSYLSEGLEFPESSLHATRTTTSECPQYNSNGAVFTFHVIVPASQFDSRRSSTSSGSTAYNDKEKLGGQEGPFRSPRELEEGFAEGGDDKQPPNEGGFFSSFRDLDNDWDELDAEAPVSGPPDGTAVDTLYEQVMDPDDPLVTGKQKECLEDPEEAEEYMWRQMSYKKRRKEKARIRIEYNVSCECFLT